MGVAIIFALWGVRYIRIKFDKVRQNNDIVSFFQRVGFLGLKGIPYSMERLCVIGLTIRKGEQKTLYKTIIKQKLIFGPAQHCEIKTPEIAIHCVVPFGPEVPMEEIQIQIILAILPVGEPVYDIPQVSLFSKEKGKGMELYFLCRSHFAVPVRYVDRCLRCKTLGTIGKKLEI